MIQTRKFLLKSGHRQECNQNVGKILPALSKRVRAQARAGQVTTRTLLAGPRRIPPLSSLLKSFPQPAVSPSPARLPHRPRSLISPPVADTLALTVMSDLTCKLKEQKGTCQSASFARVPWGGPALVPTAGCCAAHPVSREIA